MIITTMWAHIDKETACGKGKEIGLSGEALDMFTHFNEVRIEIKIDKDGVVREIKAI